MHTLEELATAAQQGNGEAVNQLREKCYGFIRQQALRWAMAWKNRADFDADDLTQAGYIAICQAVKSYQKERGDFLGFLAFYLKTEFSKVAGCRTPAQAKEPLNNAISMDAPAFADDGNETTLGDTIPVIETGFETVDNAVYIDQLAALLDAAIAALPAKQRTAIELYYLRRKTYIEIAAVLDCSYSKSRQLAKDGLQGMRTGKHAARLYEMLYGEQNYYRGTGFKKWAETGCSSPERELLLKEKRLREFIVQKLGISEEQAERLFPA